MKSDLLPGRREVTFRSLVPADLPTLHDWLSRPHVSRWWGPPPSLSDVQEDYLPLTEPGSTTRGYIALLDSQPIGFIQSYVVLGSGDGWWEVLANEEQLGQGLGTTMVRAFVDQLFLAPTATKVQADPSPENQRAIRSYQRAGFHSHGEVTTPDGPALPMLRDRFGSDPV